MGRPTPRSLCTPTSTIHLAPLLCPVRRVSHDTCSGRPSLGVPLSPGPIIFLDPHVPHWSIPATRKRFKLDLPHNCLASAALHVLPAQVAFIVSHNGPPSTRCSRWHCDCCCHLWRWGRSRCDHRWGHCDCCCNVWRWGRSRCDDHHWGRHHLIIRSCHSIVRYRRSCTRSFAFFVRSICCRIFFPNTFSLRCCFCSYFSLLFSWARRQPQARSSWPFVSLPRQTDTLQHFHALCF